MRTLVGAAEPEGPPPLAPQVTLTTNSTSAIVTWSTPMPFVCEPCKNGDHTTCDPKHCDCQHKGQ